MKPSSVTETLFENLNYRAERQKIISSNLANINTPNYKTKELSFQSALDEKMKEKDLELFSTNNKHIKTYENNNEKSSKMEIYEVENLQEQNDGNNVNLDSQMSEMSKNNTIFQALQVSIKKDSTLFRSVLDASAKN